MTQRRRVAVLVEPRRIELRDEEERAPSAGAMLVRVRAALTDGTDLKTYRRGHPHMPMPTRFGHEFCGDVVAAGAGVTRFSAGDAVMCVHTAPCTRCFWCRRGEEELCERIMETMLLGAYADTIEVPAAVVAMNAFPKPATLSYVEGAFLEPLACVVHSVERLGPVTEAVVVGDGAFGVLHALVLRNRGVDVALVGRRDQRLTLARAYGLTAIDARDGDAREAVLERTAGRGAESVVECTGAQSAWEWAPSLARRGGTVSFFGGLPAGTQVSFDAQRLHYDEVCVRSPFHFTPKAVRSAYELLCSAAIDVRPLVTHTYPLADIAAAFARLDSGDGMKACIEP